MAQLLSGGSWWREAAAPLHRAASWNPYFYRFFGSDHGQVSSRLRPLSGDQSCDALWNVVEAFGGQHPLPITLEQCLSRMWFSGYRPSDDHHFERFKQLAQKAIPAVQDKEEAFQILLAGSDDNSSRVMRAPSARLADAMVARPSARRDSKPTEVTFDGNVWGIRKEFSVRGRFDGVSALLNPINWHHLAPFFRETVRVEPRRPVTDPLEPWSGILHEKVVVNWNMFEVQSFDVFLNIDYTVAGDVTRADYSLKYEKDNQIVVDDGYAKAQRKSADTTWYIGYKRVRFASSFLNLVAPAMLAMQLENDEGGLRDILEGGGRAFAPPARTAKAAHAPKK